MNYHLSKPLATGMGSLCWIILCVAFGSLTGCENQTARTVGYRPGMHKVEVGSARVPVWCQLAADSTRRQNGLMHRDSMPDDEGMLFVFPAASVQGFWMKNCKISLDIAYIDDAGVITDILKMDAPTPGQVLFPRYKSSQPVRYVLETNVGWFARNGIEVGDRVVGYRGPAGLRPR